MQEHDLEGRASQYASTWGSIESEIQLDRQLDVPCLRDFTAEKFLDFIVHRKLTFVSAQQLAEDPLVGDKFEGLSTKIERQLYDESAKKVFEIIKRYASEGSWEEWARSGTRKRLAHHFVSCWTMDEAESLAMWMIYCRGQSGFAVQSTAKKLCTLPCLVGKVIYIEDHKSCDASAFDYRGSFFRKRKHFSYEKELRLMIEDDNEVSPIKRIDVTSQDLIDRIIVSPNTPRWVFDVVLEIVRKYAWDDLVEKFVMSTFNDEPVW